MAGTSLQKWSVTSASIRTPAVLASTELVREVGAFDEAMDRSEDYDLWMRLALQKSRLRDRRAARCRSSPCRQPKRRSNLWRTSLATIPCASSRVTSPVPSADCSSRSAAGMRWLSPRRSPPAAVVGARSRPSAGVCRSVGNTRSGGTAERKRWRERASLPVDTLALPRRPIVRRRGVETCAANDALPSASLAMVEASERSVDRDHRLHARRVRKQPANDALAVRNAVPRHLIEMRLNLQGELHAPRASCGSAARGYARSEERRAASGTRRSPATHECAGSTMSTSVSAARSVAKRSARGHAPRNSRSTSVGTAPG